MQVHASVRPSLTGVALVRDGRVLVANAALTDLTGYTRGELTSPEFRVSHLLAGEIEWPERPDEPAQTRCILTPLRGDHTSCLATTWRLASGATLLLVEPHAEPRDRPSRELALLVARETIRACSSQMADLLMRLRRVQIEVESWEHAHPEILEHEMRRIGPVFEQLQHLDADLHALAVAVGPRR